MKSWKAAALIAATALWYVSVDELLVRIAALGKEHSFKRRSSDSSLGIPRVRHVEAEENRYALSAYRTIRVLTRLLIDPSQLGMDMYGLMGNTGSPTVMVLPQQAARLCYQENANPRCNS